MRKTLLLIIGLIILCGTAVSDTKWSEIVYHYQTGTIPPPQYYKYDLTISSAGYGTLVYYPDYSEMDNWVYALKFSQDDIIKLDNIITDSNILDGSIPSLPDSSKPIGGPLKNLTVVLAQDPNLDQVPQRIKTPYFPVEGYKEKINRIYDVITKLVPQSTWDDIQSRKDEFIKNYKK